MRRRQVFGYGAAGLAALGLSIGLVIMLFLDVRLE